MQTVDQLRSELTERCENATRISISNIQKPLTIKDTAYNWVSIKFEYYNKDNPHLDPSVIYNLSEPEYIRCYQDIIKKYIYKIDGKDTK